MRAVRRTQRFPGRPDLATRHRRKARRAGPGYRPLMPMSCRQALRVIRRPARWRHQGQPGPGVDAAVGVSAGLVGGLVESVNHFLAGELVAELLFDQSQAAGYVGGAGGCASACVDGVDGFAVFQATVEHR